MYEISVGGEFIWESGGGENGLFSAGEAATLKEAASKADEFYLNVAYTYNTYGDEIREIATGKIVALRGREINGQYHRDWVDPQGSPINLTA